MRMCVPRRLPTPIQAEVVPLILGGGDVMAAAETGSGKTGAFALPVLQIVHEALAVRQRAAAAASTATLRCGGGAAAQPAAGAPTTRERAVQCRAVRADGIGAPPPAMQCWRAGGLLTQLGGQGLHHGYHPRW